MGFLTSRATTGYSAIALPLTPLTSSHSSSSSSSIPSSTPSGGPPAPPSISTFHSASPSVSGAPHRPRSSRLRPSVATVSFALLHLSFFLWWTHKARPTLSAAQQLLLAHDTTLLSSSSSSSSSLANLADNQLATQSCEVCILNPNDPLCHYGIDSVRMSRQYEGSAARVRKALEKALRGEEIGIGVIGASVTAGHSVLPGQQKWQDKFYADFLTMFPTAKMHVGAIGATDSRFFSYCWEAVVPRNLDIYIVELDINNNPGLETLRDDDALMRGLLEQPNEPAVIRVSAIAILFDELARGSISTLITSEFFDVPVIGLRFLLPHLIKHRETAETIFGLDAWGNRDYRHMSDIGHAALADMLSLYLRKEVCEARRSQVAPRPERNKASEAIWPLREDLGKVPGLALWSKWTKPVPLIPITPLCRTVNTPLSYLTPVSHSPEFTLIEWNDKHAWSSSTPGSQIRFSFRGTKVGIFVYTTSGRGKDETSTEDGGETKKREAPGLATCWIEDVGEHDADDKMEKRGKKKVSIGRGARKAWEVNTHWPERGPSGAEFVELTEGLEPTEHVLACEVSTKTTSGGYKWRVQGIASQ
ncbi:hypothetical protein JCM10212_004090 [Sporobolomyces blumeae]